MNTGFGIMNMSITTTTTATMVTTSTVVEDRADSSHRPGLVALERVSEAPRG